MPPYDLEQFSQGLVRQYTIKIRKQELDHIRKILQKQIAAGYDIVSYSDGACRNNPGPSGAGCAFFAVKHVAEVEEESDSEVDDEVQLNLKEEKFLFGAQMFLDYCTNNYAEYLGLILSQVLLSLARVPQAIFRADSQLLVNQVKGLSAVKNIRFVSMMPIVHDLIKHFKQVQIEYISRDENKVADSLAKDAASKNVGFSPQ